MKIDIPGYPGYAAVDDGNIWSDKSGRLLTKRVDAHGYYRVWLTLTPKQRNVKVARLVALAFVQNPNNLDTVDHINNDKLDDRPENLQWLSVSANSRKAWDDGLVQIHTKRGEDSTGAKLTEKDVESIRSAYPAESQSSIAKKYGISQQQVSKIILRKRWNHL